MIGRWICDRMELVRIPHCDPLYVGFAYGAASSRLNANHEYEVAQ